jgi:predicted DNA-binding protein YlxM (UPF0122 family)
MGKMHDNLSRERLDTKAKHRDRIELLRRRVNLLKEKDKLLMTMYLDNSNSCRQISRLTGVNVSSIARKIDKLSSLLLEGKYILCLHNRDKFNISELAIAKDFFLLGLPIKKIAAKRHWTYYRVYKTIKKIQQQICGKSAIRLVGKTVHPLKQNFYGRRTG